LLALLSAKTAALGTSFHFSVIVHHVAAFSAAGANFCTEFASTFEELRTHRYHVNAHLAHFCTVAQHHAFHVLVAHLHAVNHGFHTHFVAFFTSLYGFLFLLARVFSFYGSAHGLAPDFSKVNELFSA
jgi:hypothetical protein